MLEADAASLWDQDKLPAFAIFKADQKKFYLAAFPDRCIQQAASNSLVNSRLSQDVQNKRQRQPFLCPCGPTASGLCKKSSSLLLLSLTRATTEVVYIAHGRGRGRGKRKVNRSPKSKVSWWKKRFRQCRFFTQQQEAQLFWFWFPIRTTPLSGMVMYCRPRAEGASLNSRICPKKL